MKKKRVVCSSDDESVTTVRPVNMRRISDSDDDSSDGYDRILTVGSQPPVSARPRIKNRPRPKVVRPVPKHNGQPIVLLSDVSDSDSGDDASFLDEPSDSDSDMDIIPAVDAVLERSQTTGNEIPDGPRQKSRGWCVTVNNYDDDAIRGFRNFHDSTAGCKYLIIGKEIGESGTPHLQIYLYVENPRYGNVLRQACGSKGHWIAAKGTPAQNQTYCSKGYQLPGQDKVTDFMEYGELPKQGKRNDLETLGKRICTEGATMDTLVTGGEYDVLATYLRYERAASRLVQHVAPERDPAVIPTVHWIWGSTGTGKSKWAWENYPKAYRVPTCGGGWWDGYYGQDTVVLDDYRANAFSFSQLLKIIDRYPMRVQNKGGFVNLAATTFIFTTTNKPEECYAKSAEDVAQLMRRITKVERFGPEPLAPIFNLGPGN